MRSDEPLPSLEPDALDDVTGGVASSDANVTAALQGIQSSLKSIGTNNTSNNGLQALLPFLLFARGRAGGGLGGTCPCGCGMANCGR